MGTEWLVMLMIPMTGLLLVGIGLLVNRGRQGSRTDAAADESAGTWFPSPIDGTWTHIPTSDSGGSFDAGGSSSGTDCGSPGADGGGGGADCGGSN
jgi:hypothetical protein